MIGQKGFLDLTSFSRLLFENSVKNSWHKKTGYSFSYFLSFEILENVYVVSRETSFS